MVAWLKAFALAALALLAPVKAIVYAAMALTAIDGLLGVLAARRRGERVTSAGLRRTVAKATAYLLAIIAGYLTGHYLLSDTVPVASLVAGAIGVVEGTSCLENAGDLARVDVFDVVVSKLGSVNDRRARRRKRRR